MPTRRAPSSTARAVTASAMCSQGSGVAACSGSQQMWAELSGQMAKSAPAAASTPAESSMIAASASRSPASKAGIQRAIAIESIVTRG